MPVPTIPTIPTLGRRRGGVTVAAVPATYSQAVLADSPIDYWRLGEPSGTSAADAGSAPNTGTYVNTPTLGVTGAIAGDTAVTLARASAQYVQCKNGVIVAALTNATVEAWVNWTNAAGAIYCERGATGNAIWKLETDASGVLFFTHRNDGATLNSFNLGLTLVAGTWAHVAVTKATTSIRAYKDGVLSGSSPQTLTGADNLSATSIQSRIGSDIAAGASGYWNGSVDEVALYNTTLSAARILVHATSL